MQTAGWSAGKWTIEARVAPLSVGSGYWGLLFLDAKNEQVAKKPAGTGGFFHQ